VEGHNIILEFRFARGDRTVGPRLAAELMALAVDVIVLEGIGPPNILDPSGRIPIVSPVMMNPVESGFAASLAHPAGTVTGFTLMHTELNGKRLELLHTAFPQITVVAALLNSANPGHKLALEQTETAAQSMGLGMSAESRSKVRPPWARCVRMCFPEPAGWSSCRTGCSTIFVGTS